MRKALLLSLLLAGVSVMAIEVPEAVGGYKAPPFDLHNYTMAHLKSASLPTAYDSRDYGYITQSRNQSTNGPCWAFATCDAVEACFTKSGDKPGWLSPEILIDCHDGFLWSKTEGGNSHISSSMLCRLVGPAYEDNIPFSTQESDCSEYTADDIPAYSLESYVLPENDAEAIKECIYNYGAVTAAIYYNPSYYNIETNTYCYTGESLTNHGISLIGWNDDEKVFIAKFNYGATKFQNGCLKISYSDRHVKSNCYAFPSYITKNDVEKAYYYNKTGCNGFYYFEDAETVVSAISYFDTGDSEELLEYAGAFVDYQDEEVTFTVLSGSDAYSKKLKAPYRGFHVVKFDSPIPVKGKFIVAVDYPSKQIPCEMEYAGYNEPEFLPSGNQFIQIDNKEEFTFPIGTDTPHYNNINLSIKAYTRAAEPTKSTEISKALTPVVIDGKINPEIWNEAETIDLYTTDGHLVQHLTSEMFVNSKGLFIFVIRNSSGERSSIELLK